VGSPTFGVACASALSEAVREFVEREAETIVQWHVSPEFIAAAAQVLHERVTGSYGS
jgi:hypothetical protein